VASLFCSSVSDEEKNGLVSLTPADDVIKPFLPVIYKFSYYARVFLRIGWKSLSGTNTQLITKICKLGTKKFYNIDTWSI